jgi:hypothetical protein
VDWRQLLHNRWALAGLVGAAGVGGYVLWTRRKSTAGTSDTTTTTAGASGTPTLDTSGTDIANWLGQYSGSLQNELDQGLAAYQNSLSDIQTQLAGLPTAGGSTSTTSTTPGTSTTPTTTPSGNAQYVTVAKYTSSSPAWNSTLSGIAKHEGTSVSTLLSLNPQIKNANVIITGSQIRVR